MLAWAGTANRAEKDQWHDASRPVHERSVIAGNRGRQRGEALPTEQTTKEVCNDCCCMHDIASKRMPHAETVSSARCAGASTDPRCVGELVGCGRLVRYARVKAV